MEIETHDFQVKVVRFLITVGLCGGKTAVLPQLQFD